MKKIYILLLITSFSLTIQAQIQKDAYLYLQSQIPEENLNLQVNTDLFVTGEKILYKTFVFNTKTNALSTISKYAYVSLIGKDKTIHFNHKLKTNNGQAFGDYFIPSGITTGHYKLITYTNWSKNNIKDSYAEKDIYIINPYYNSSKAQTNNLAENKIDIKKADTLIKHNYVNNNLKITTNKQKLNTREKAQIKISNPLNMLQDISVSIKKIDSISAINYSDDILIENTNTDNYFLPELRGQLISGSIQTKDNSSISNKTVTMSITGEDFILKNAKTNEHGVFVFNLDKNYESVNVIFQIQEQNPENFKITIDTNHFSKNIIDQLTFNPINLDPNIKDWLNQKSINNQVENAFYTEKLDSISATTFKELFYHPNAKTYNLDDFNRFKTIKETFIEIIYASSITKSGDNYKFSVHDYDNPILQNTVTSDPLVIVDGLLITNNNDIVDYSSYRIDKIAVVIGLYVYGAKVYNGIISFKTKNNDFSLQNISNQGDFITQVDIKKLESKKTYSNPNYEENGTNLERIPDYRNQLLWLPNVNLNKGENIFNFFTSDNLGTYEITIEGYTPRGELIKANSFFKVN